MKYKLKDIGIIITGKTPSTKENENFSVKEDKYLFLTPRDMSTSAKYIKKTERYLTDNVTEKFKMQIIKANSVCISCIGSDMGKVYMVDRDTVTNQQINSITKINSICNPHYLYYYFKDKKEYLKSIAGGSTMPILNKSTFENIEIDLPDIHQQDRIVTIVENIDKKIELNNQINNNLLEIGKNCFKRWLENCNEEKYIYEIADEIIDYEKNSNSKVKLLNSSDITENVFPKVEYVENKNLKGHFKKRFKKHDILYSQIRPSNHHFGYSLIENCEEYLISTRFMVVRNKPSLVSSSLLYFYLTSDKAIRDFTAKTESKSGTFPQGNFEDLSSYRVKYSANQIQITNILDKVLNKFYKNNMENELLEEIRDTLLPKLMNGEIDLDKIKI